MPGFFYFRSKLNYMKIKLLVFLIAVLSVSSCSEETIILNSPVFFAESHIVITNNDDFGYQDPVIKINQDFIYKPKTIPAGESIRVHLREFANSSGVRFSNDFKPLNISITCAVRGAEKGFFYKDFD